MPAYKILHSGQYWQDLRRRSKEAKAARTAREAGQEAQVASFVPTLCGGSHVFTFIPGRSQPSTSLQQRNGKLLPVSGPSRTGTEEEKRVATFAAEWKTRRHAEEQTRLLRAKRLRQVLQRQYLSAGTCSQLSQKAEEADADMLARLKGKNPKKKRSRVEDTAPADTSKKAKVR
jgi:hypothetical protein